MTKLKAALVQVEDLAQEILNPQVDREPPRYVCHRLRLAIIFLHSCGPRPAVETLRASYAEIAAIATAALTRTLE